MQWSAKHNHHKWCRNTTRDAPRLRASHRRVRSNSGQQVGVKIEMHIADNRAPYQITASKSLPINTQPRSCLPVSRNLRMASDASWPAATTKVPLVSLMPSDRYASHLTSGYCEGRASGRCCTRSGSQPVPVAAGKGSSCQADAPPHMLARASTSRCSSYMSFTMVGSE